MSWTTPTLKRLDDRAWFRWAEVSSRFDRLPSALLWIFAQYVVRRQLIVFTEVANDKRAAVLRRLPGWEVDQGPAAGGRDECAVAYRRRYFRKVWGRNHALTKTQPTSGFHVVYARFTLLEHWRTGQTVLVSVAHTPAHVEDGDKWRRTKAGKYTADVLAYRELLREWPRLLKVYAARPDVDHVLALGDLNVNHRRKVWLERLTKAFAPYHSVWSRHMPAEGTHKTSGRLIDGGFTDMWTDALGIGPLTSQSDHRPVFGRCWLRPITDTAKTADAWRKIIEARHKAWANRAA